MSRGPGRVMLAIRDALRAVDAPLTLTEIASSLYGPRPGTRYHGRHRRRVAVPNGDPSNIRRALKGLLRSGTVVEVLEAAFPEFARRKGQIRYAISDRFTGNASGSACASPSRHPVDPPTAPVTHKRAAPPAGSSGGDGACEVAVTLRRGETMPLEEVHAVEELTDEERVFLDFLADRAVGILKERLARGESPDG